MIKASEGGGGKGIRKCEDERQFATVYRQVEGTSFFIHNFLTPDQEKYRDHRFLS
jgi:biotin carboxylase